MADANIRNATKTVNLTERTVMRYKVKRKAYRTRESKKTMTNVLSVC